MSVPSPQQKPFNSATRIGVSAVGVLCGLAGMEHGVGEILQGNVATSGMVINAWQPSSPRARVKLYLVVSVCFKDFRVAAQNVHCRSNPRSFMFPRCARVSAACADPLSLGVGKGYMAGLSNHTACRSILFVISSYSLFWLLYA